MLVLLTLLAVSAIESTTSSVQMVSNAQFKEEATAAAQQAIENVISNAAFTTTPPTAQNIDVNNDGITDYIVSFTAPACNKYAAVDTANDPTLPKDCYGSPGITLCYRAVWDVSAVVNDVTTGAQVAMHQGVKVLVGLNAALSSCGA